MATLKRMLSCICDWLAVAEHFSSTNNAFAKEYDTLEPKVTEELTEIVRICNDMLAERDSTGAPRAFAVQPPNCWKR